MPKVHFSGQDFDAYYERLKKCIQENSDKFEVRDGGAKGSRRGAHPAVGDPFSSSSSLGCGLLKAEGTRRTSARKVKKYRYEAFMSK